MKAKNCVLIVPFHQGQQYVSNLLTSWNERSDVIVIDNSPTRFKGSANVRIILAEPNIGFGRAVNLGIKQALLLGYHYAIVANQDTTIIDLDLTEFLSRSMGDYDIVIPIMQKHNTTEIEEHVKDWYGISFGRDSINGELKDNYVIDFSALFFFGLKLDWVSHGLFDPAFHMYKEDRDLINVIQSHSGRLILHTKSVVGHVGSGSRNKNYRLGYNFIRSTILYNLRYSHWSQMKATIEIIKAGLRSCKYGPIKDSFRVLSLIFQTSSLKEISKISDRDSRITGYLKTDFTESKIAL